MKKDELLDDAGTAMDSLLKELQSKIWTALPAIVESVDLDKQTISAQPSISAVTTNEDGEERDINLPLLIDVPICYTKGGGFAITVPLKKGDEVLIVFSSRCIDSWWQSGGIGAQAEYRQHDLSDGFAILAPTSQPKRLKNVSPDSLEIRTESGECVMSFKNDSVVLKSSKVTIEANVIINGDLTTNGTFTNNGDLIANGSFTNNGVNVGSNHVHSGVRQGSDNTGAPR